MNLRVLEFGENVAAGYCGRLFALWGADVVRVDALAGPGDGAPHRVALDAYLHPGKRRLGLDLEAPQGRHILHRLADTVDVIITDAPVADLDRLGWADLGGAAKVKAAITAFGLDGPYRDWQASPSVLLAMGGYTYLMGDPGREPLTLPGHYPEYQAGQYAYLSALATASGRDPREPPGAGPQLIDVSVLETILSLSQFTTVMWTFQSKVRTRHGNHWENVHPLSLYRCLDGWVCFNVVHHFWGPFTELLGRPELAGDPRFSSNGARMQHQAELDEIINRTTATRTVAEVIELGQRQHRVPVGPMLTIDQVLESPHLAARDFWQRLELANGATVVVPGPAWRIHGEPVPGPGRLQPRPDSPTSDVAAEGVR